MKKLTIAFLMVIALSMNLRADDFQIGIDAYCSGDYQHAQNVFRPLADNGHVGAQLKLGLMHLQGQGVPKNYVETLHWLKLASERGSTEALYWLAYMYEYGVGVPEDLTEQLKLTITAAQGGYPDAQSSLGLIFSELKSYSSTYVDEAIRWLREAAENGDGFAQEHLGDMFYEGMFEGNEVPQDYYKAAWWYRGSAEKGYGDAQAKLGLMYLKGQGVNQDELYAYAWMSIAQDGIPDVLDMNLVELRKRMTDEQEKEAEALKERLIKDIVSQRKSACRKNN